MREKLTSIDHPIFHRSIRYIRAQIGNTSLDPIEEQVLERLIHTSGDFEIQNLLHFSNGACIAGISALKNGAPIITDTSMAAAAVRPMASKTLSASVHCALDWSPENGLNGMTRTAIGMQIACKQFSQEFQGDRSPVVVIGSSPTALIAILDLVSSKEFSPSLVIGMPVGFISVLESKKLLSTTHIPQIIINGHRGGAALAAAAANSLLRASVLS